MKNTIPITYQVATENDLNEVLILHSKNQLDTMSEEDKEDGFITTAFTKELLLDLIEREEGLFIAKQGDEILAYVMSGSWHFWSQWPMFQHMIKGLGDLTYLNQTLSTENSYQYGPVCVAKECRGSGVLEGIFDFARQKMALRFPILVTFVNKVNSRSVEAHRRKLGLDVIQEFEYKGNQYYEMVYDTSKKLGK